jgi:hypothetical protein
MPSIVQAVIHYPSGYPSVSRLCRVVSAFAAFALICPLSVVPAQGQISDVTNSTSSPIQGAGHDYIKMLNESVNPANGSVSLRIQVPTSPGRRLSLPFAFAYDSNSARHLGSWNDGIGGIGWLDNTAYLAKGGWSYSIPMLTDTTVTESLPGREYAELGEPGGAESELGK